MFPPKQWIFLFFHARHKQAHPRRYEMFLQHPALNNLYLRIQRMSWQLYFNIVYIKGKSWLSPVAFSEGPEFVSRPRGGLSWCQILRFSPVPLGKNQDVTLTLILLTWRIWWSPNNASKWQMGFYSFKGLNYTTSISFHVLSSSLFNIHSIIQSHTTEVTTKHYATRVALQFECKMIFRQLTCTWGRHEGGFKRLSKERGTTAIWN